MLWQGRRGSSNVEDRRGVSGGQVAVGGGILGVIALVINFLLGGDGSQLPQQLPNQNTPLSAEEQAADDQRAQFVKVVLAETEDVWNTLFQQSGKNYAEPTLEERSQRVVRPALQQGLFIAPVIKKYI
jgi:predicted metalloprotease